MESTLPFDARLEIDFVQLNDSKFCKEQAKLYLPFGSFPLNCNCCIVKTVLLDLKAQFPIFCFETCGHDCNESGDDLFWACFVLYAMQLQLFHVLLCQNTIPPNLTDPDKSDVLVMFVQD